MAAPRGILVTLSSLFLLLPLAAVVDRTTAAGEVHCDVICNFQELQAQCERCKQRHPMRFGKRSSPPENEMDVTASDAAAENTKMMIESSMESRTMPYLADALAWYRHAKMIADRQMALRSSSLSAVFERRRKRSLETEKPRRRVVGWWRHWRPLTLNGRLAPSASTHPFYWNPDF